MFENIPDSHKKLFDDASEFERTRHEEREAAKSKKERDERETFHRLAVETFSQYHFVGHQLTFDQDEVRIKFGDFILYVRPQMSATMTVKLRVPGSAEASQINKSCTEWVYNTVGLSMSDGGDKHIRGLRHTMLRLTDNANEQSKRNSESLQRHAEDLARAKHAEEQREAEQAPDNAEQAPTLGESLEDIIRQIVQDELDYHGIS